MDLDEVISSPRLIDDDEVIADSEEEPMDQGGDLFPESGGAGVSGLNRSSSVSNFTALGLPPPGSVSGISTFTENLHKPENRLARMSSIETTGVDKGKGKAADTSIMSSFTDYEGANGVLSIADRAKTRQRVPKLPPSSIIEIPSDDEWEVNIKPSNSKAKSKVKPKPKVKDTVPKDTPPPVPDANAEAPAKPKPRPRPRPKQSKPTHEGVGLIPIPGAGHSEPSSHNGDGHTPVSTTPAINTTHEDNIPRIETLPNQNGSNIPSSPSSLFDDLSSPSRKRKRGTRDTDAEVDQLEPSQNGPPVTYADYTARRYYQGPGYVDPSKLPPPSTFFAGSSQSQSSRVSGQGPAPPSEHLLENEIVDLTMFPTQDATFAVKTPLPKPKKSKKPRVFVEDEILMPPPPMMVLDEDDQDEDFDPKADGSSKKKKKKSKATPKDKRTPATDKASKAKEATQTTSSSKPKSKTLVEVVITTKPPKKGKTKGKEKSNPSVEDAAKGDNEGSKVTYKSAEFIEDSDEEADPLRLVGRVDPVLGQTPTITSTTPNSKKGGASGTTSAAAPAPPTSVAPTHKPLSTSNPQISSSSKAKPLPEISSQVESGIDSDMPKTSSSSKKRTSGTTKRKAVLDSDDDQAADPGEGDEVVLRSSSAARKKKRGEKDSAKSKAKAKNAVLSDAEDETLNIGGIDEEAVEPVKTKGKGKDKDKTTKKAKAASRVIPDEGDEIPQDGPQDLHQDDPDFGEADATKENIEPTPVKATPKAPNYTRASATNTTPLYERYEVAPRKSSLPMSELIRRANSMPGSPFPVAPSSSKLKPLTGRRPSSTAYSPYLKSSRSLLSRIAPLHPNRRTPPPPPPPPPPRKKTKKELELEEKWEEELVESVGGVEAWAAMQDDERKELRKAKWARELGGWDD